MDFKKKIIFFCCLIINSCFLYKGGNRNFYILSNSEYNKFFKDLERIEYTLIKYFNRNFFRVHIKKLSSFSGFLNEFTSIANKDKNSIIFVNDFLISTILNNKDIFSNNRIITYNTKDINKDSLSIFNIYVNPQLLADTILTILNKEKKSKDFSDFIILFDSNYYMSREIVEIIKSKNKDIRFVKVFSESQIKKYLESEAQQLSMVILLGYGLNKVLVDIDRENKEKIVKIKFLEIFSNYLEILNLSGYSLNINWDNAVLLSFYSEEFRAFLKQKEIKSYDFKISKNMGILKINKKSRLAFLNSKKDPSSD